MLFNSFAFAAFLPTVLLLYWNLGHKNQNRLVLGASYFFYGYWDWRFLGLILFSTIVDYGVGLRLGSANAPRQRKRLLAVSVATNLTLLGFFKYCNFFIDSANRILLELGLPISPTLDIVLPVGISFYTFQTMSYTIDIYRGQLAPTRSFSNFALFVAFFPQLVAGPIERAVNLLPRLEGARHFDKAQFRDGLMLILWGLFKKVYVADNLARLVALGFNDSGSTPGETALIATYAFAFQIYCDFSGYSSIARGCGKCLGIELMPNFNFPYVALTPPEFWRRWHISLSTWLRDYLYIPLGGNRGSRVATYRNLSFTMLLGGLWHGASWLFVLWGAYQGLLLVLHRLSTALLGKPATPSSRGLVRSILQWGLMFHLVCLGWILFRAVSLDQLTDVVSGILTWRTGSSSAGWIALLQYAGPVILLEAIHWKTGRGVLDARNPWLVRVCTSAILFYLVAIYGAHAEEFIYFQF